MKQATVYKRNNKYIFHSLSKTTIGAWIISEPVFVLDIEVTEEEIKEKILLALNNSKIDIPHPTTWTGLFTPVLKQAAVKTWKDFMKNNKCVLIEKDNNLIKFIPTKNLGDKEGFDHLKEKSISLDIALVNKIGVEFLKAIELCQ